MYKKITLKNGLRLLLIPRRETSVFTALIVFAVGSRQESNKLAGISHLLEHMAYKGTKKRPTQKDLAEFVDSLGGEHNAFTSKEYTGYYVKAASNHLPKVLDFLSDNISNSIYRPEDINREKSVILEEIKMYEDIPQAKVGELFELSALGDNSLGRPIIGRADAIKSISREDLINYHKNHYSYANAVIVIAGNFQEFDQKYISDQIESLFKLNREKSAVNSQFVKPSQFKPEILIRKTEQSNVAVGFLGPDIKNKDWHTATILAKILGGSMSSRMFSQIREKQGLTYNISTDFRSFSDTGLFSTFAGVANHNVEKVTAAIMNEYLKIRQEKVSDSELNRAKEMLKGGLLIAMEDSEELANSYALDELMLKKIETYEETIAKYQKVTADEILECAEKYFDPKGVIFAAVGPDIEGDRIDKLLK